MVRCLAGFIALLMLFTAPVYAVDSSTPAQIPLPFKHVTLYTSGVGYFQRSGVVDGDATDTLYFPLSEINDVLKSLVLLDEGGGAIQPVTYAAKDPIGKQLQAFTVDVSDNPDRASRKQRCCLTASPKCCRPRRTARLTYLQATESTPYRSSKL